jgi:hypothetical protein
MKRKRIRKVLDYLSILVIICLPSLLWTFHHIDRYFHWISFYCILILIGLILGFLIFQFVSRGKIELKKYRTKTGVGLIHAILAISVMLTPMIGILISENIGVINTTKNYEIDHTGHSGGGAKNKTIAYYIFIKNDNNKIERLQFGKAFVNKNSRQDSVLLNYNIGSLGFAYYSIPKRIK